VSQKHSENQSPIRWSLRSLYGFTFAFVLALALSVLAVLLHLHQKVDDDLQDTTQSLTRSLDLMFEGQIDAIDVALVAAAHEIGHSAKAGKTSISEINSYLELLRSNLPRTEVLRATNPSGDILYGTHISEPYANVGDREYFIRLRENPDLSLVIIPPLMARTDNKWIWAFARRINKPDGAFGGVVFARLDIPGIEKMFKQVNMDSSGFIALRHQDLSLIARYQSKGENQIPVGDKKLSGQFRSMLDAGIRDGTFILDQDNSFNWVSRTVSYRQNPKYGFLIMVGEDRDIAFAGWRSQAWLAGGLALALAASALKIARLISESWARKKKNKATRRIMDEQLRQIAFYDPLTQLPNRRLLSDRLAQAMIAGKRSGNIGALMFVDLDNFKPLNDHHGHELGDLLLIEVANRLRNCVRKVDTVARFGGDEFVILLSDLGTDKSESAQRTRVLAEKILVSIANPYDLPLHGGDSIAATVTHHCSASIGVILFVDHEMSPSEALRLADEAMYQAKEAGRNRIHFSG
jgi:diguanylate cyclase (GGDEF)-like protein